MDEQTEQAAPPEVQLSERLNSYSTYIREGDSEKFPISSTLSGLGMIVGIVMAYRHKRRTLGYIGYAAIGMAVGHVTGSIIGLTWRSLFVKKYEGV